MRHKRLTCANRSCSMPFLYFLFVFLAPAGLRLVGHWKQEMLLFRKFKDPKSLAHSHTKPHFFPPQTSLISRNTKLFTRPPNDPQPAKWGWKTTLLWSWAILWVKVNLLVGGMVFQSHFFHLEVQSSYMVSV